MHNGHAHTLRSHRFQEIHDLIARRTQVGVMVWGTIGSYQADSEGNVYGAVLHAELPDGSTVAVPLTGVDILHPSDAED